jgi:cytochrome c peroxidase
LLPARLLLLTLLLSGCGSGTQGPRLRQDAAAEPPLALVLVAPGAPVDVDAARAISPAGPLPQVRVQLSADAHGLVVAGSRIQGRFAGVGAVRVTATTMGNDGAAIIRVFNIVAPAPEPGEPQLPAEPAVYEDFRLGMPAAYVESRRSGAPFWDTTPASNPVTDAGATLGRVLFYDKRLSATNTHSCGSCHQQRHGFADPRAFSIGVTGEATRRNAMALANVRYSLRNRFFADGRVRTLESLVLLPIQDPVEMGNTLANLETKLRATRFYAPLFQQAFGTPGIDSGRIAMALAQFLRTLVSYRAPVDTAYPDGSASQFPMPTRAFTAEQNLGLKLLVEGNCLHCHVDRVLTMVDPSNNGLDVSAADAGQGDGAFRSASLRNIARTGPYMHDGRFGTLREVIDHYDHDVRPAPALSPLLRVRNGDAPRRLGMTEREKRAMEAILDAFTDRAMLEDPRFSDPFR